MDLLNLIRQKVRDFEGTTMHEGLKAVVHHIEIAERHFVVVKLSRTLR